MHTEASERQLLETDLRQAIERGELSVAYQPIVRAAGEEISGFEALVRWTHPSRGPIPPDKFVPLAEEAGLIGKIGEWVMKTALEEAAKWPDQVQVAVNVSPLQFNDQARRNGRRLAPRDRSSRRPPGNRDHRGRVPRRRRFDRRDLRPLKELGVRLALDDFGTGYSSLGYLKKAPFDKIKIDQSFVRGASMDFNQPQFRDHPGDRHARRDLGMDTCAEGVETHDDLQLIRELGVSMVQGYIFGRPATPRRPASWPMR